MNSPTYSILFVLLISICYGQTNSLFLDAVHDYCLLESEVAFIVSDFSTTQNADILEAVFVELKQISDFHQGPESCFENTSTNLISFVVVQLEVSGGMFFATSMKVQKNILNNGAVIHDLIYKSGPTIYIRGRLGFDGFKEQVVELARKEFEIILFDIINN